jgi:hypothetical protein
MSRETIEITQPVPEVWYRSAQDPGDPGVYLCTPGSCSRPAFSFDLQRALWNMVASIAGP